MTTTKQEEFEKLLDEVIEAGRAHARVEAAKDALRAFVFPPAPVAPTLRHPWEIPAEEYVAAWPALFTAENGWHTGKEDGDESLWRTAGDGAWSGFTVLQKAQGGGEHLQNGFYGGTDPFDLADLRAALDALRAGKQPYKHPLGLARR